MYTSSTSIGLMPALSIAALMTIDPSFVADTFESDFWKDPIGVLTAETMTICCG
jgi:hypothetical protein